MHGEQGASWFLPGTCLTCRYDSHDPLDLGEALWLVHWGLGPDAPAHPGQQQPAPWAWIVSRTSLAALGEL